MSKTPKSKEKKASQMKWAKLAEEAEHEKKAFKEERKALKEEKRVTKAPVKKAKKEEHFEAALQHLSYKKLEDELNEAEEKFNQATNQILRLQAELANSQKRAERDVSNAHKYGVEKLIFDLLPVIDSLENGLETEVGDNEFAKNLHAGMELILSMLQKTLEKFGVEILDPVGKVFNPEFHEAMTMQESSDVDSNTVITVFQKGYLLNQRLVRPALVVVAK